jgi:hypothetical protein
MNRRRLVVFVAMLAATGSGARALLTGEPAPGTVSGVVGLEGGGPAAWAWVRVQATENLVYTAEDGSFLLEGVPDGASATITASYPGYKVGWALVVPPAGNVTITLRPYDPRDNKSYAWNTSYPDPANLTLGCGHCMSPSFGEWRNTAHAGSGTNPRFFSMYNGSDVKGTKPVLPGYKNDFPGTAGNCATCHAPGAAADAPFTTDMNSLAGVNREGVFCEFCHKVGAVYINPATGRPYNNAPGVVSMRLYRPFGDDQIFFGTVDDVTRRVSYLPVERRSEFCAPCHQFSFWGTPIYESFREWKESPFPAQGVECQSCHMASGLSPIFCLPEKGGLSRNPQRLASHLDLGVKDLDFMQATVQMKLTAQRVPTGVQATVTLTNVLAGHHVPTDFPGRHMLLTATATDAQGRALVLQDGSKVPEWGGDLAGRPGRAYAKILRDVATGELPVVSYWKRSQIVSDNRIPAYGSDVSRYTFVASQTGSAVKVTARLIFRRLFQATAKAKGWDAPDIVMAEAETRLNLSQ